MAKPLMDALKLPNAGHNDLHYVVAVDDSGCAKHAFKWADCLANKDDKLTIIHSFETDQQLAIVNDRYIKYTKENNNRFELEILNDSRYSVGKRIKHFVNAGQKETADILVTGLYGKTHENLASNKRAKVNITGSTSDLSLRSARCSSFFVRREVPIPSDQSKVSIVVGVDGSQNSLHAFEFATKVLCPGNTLYVVHIETEYSNKKQIPEHYQSSNVIKNYTKYIENAKKTLGFKVNMEIKLVEGTINICHGLCKFVTNNKCHILCVGADGMTAHCNKQPILGSVSDECVKHCQCNIIVTQINEYNSTPRGSINEKY